MFSNPVPPSGGCASAAPARHAACTLLLLIALAPAHAQRAGSPRPLSDLSLEELMEVEVTTVSKHREKLAAAPAAVFALNADDTQRAAVTSLPDALRLVPGVQVGRVAAHSWAISARGFADVFANKLLVLQDGRSVYTPLFSGTFWDAQDTLLEDIDRIEVVRGPGATLWGANAVNGVINILTKPASQTQGLLAAVTAGTDPELSARVRYGTALDKDTHLRVYAKHTHYDSSEQPAGGDAGDAWRRAQAGFRLDRRTAAGNVLTLQGDAYRGREDQTFFLPTNTVPFVAPLASETTFDGANVLGRFTRRFPSGSELMVQSYFDYTDRDAAIFGETRRTFDLEAQQRFAAGRQEVIFGAGYRNSADRVRNTPFLSLNPARRRLDLWNAFVQDDIELNKTTHLIVGSKVEHNDFTGWELQPGARLLFTPNDRHTFWGSITRAVRTPARSEDDVILRQITAVPGVHAISVGNRSYDSEKLIAYEAGWRFHAREKFSVDLALFANHYDGLRSSELTAASLDTLARLANPLTVPPFPVVVTASPANAMRGEAYGGELALAVQLAPGWRIRAAYSRLKMSLRRDAASSDTSSEAAEGRSPRDQGYLWSQHDFGRAWRLDLIARAVGRLPATGVPSYVTADVRLSWRPHAQWEFSLAGRNLLEREHLESVPTAVLSPTSVVERSATVEIKYAF